MSISDAAQRADAIDPTRSFCVSAPAGSGKTELLIQRYLALLARVERPEQILAITFTRKAAAEMRERVVGALQAARQAAPCDNPHQQTTRELASRALLADTRGGWHLVRDISRLNIKTIDSFCGALTRQMPVLSEFGGQASVLDDAGELYAEAVAELFRGLDEQHPVAADLAAVMLHFDNNWERLQELLVAMLARREQWRSYVGVHHTPRESEAYLAQTVQSLVRDELGALATRLAAYAGELLDLLQYAARNLGRPPPTRFPGSEPDEVAAWRAVRALLLTDEGGWRKRLDKTIGFPAGKGEAQARKDQLQALLRELADIDGLRDMLAAVSFLPQVTPGSASWQLLVHLSRLLPLLAAQLLLVFQKYGAVDHSQVALAALQALGDDDAPTELAMRLDYGIEHILVDEFQDTAINQYDLLGALTRGWGEHNAQHPQAPRTVMVVGDGMQSIYGFRGANVGLFLKARREGFNGIRLQALELRSNFRSDEGVVEWINDAFTQAFPARENINRGQVSFTPASAVRPAALPNAVTMHAFHRAEGAEGQAQEVDFICGHIAALGRDPDVRSIAVLGRSRGHLQPVIAGLQGLGIAYSAAALDSLARSPLVADLLTLCRALANHADRLAWLALLRAPWCALQLADLLQLGRHGDAPAYEPVWRSLCNAGLRSSLSPDGRRRLEAILPVLQRAERQRDRLSLRVWIEQAWVGLGGPGTAVDPDALRDAESFFQLLEQADCEGVGLDPQWLSQRVEKQFMNSGGAATQVQLMTLHRAKGLEFDCVIIPQLARTPRSDGRQLLLWDEHSSPAGERHFLLAADDHSEPGAPTLYNYLQQQRLEKSLLENTRLLYVGATRAIRQLTLSASLSWDEKKETFRAPASRSLLGSIWPVFAQQMIVHEPSPAAASRQAPPTVRPLLRLRRETAAPAAAIPRESAAQGSEQTVQRNLPDRAENHVERCIGTVVHLALEELSQLPQLPGAVTAAQRSRWRQALQCCGLWGEPLDAALAAAVASIERALAPGGPGRWLLDSGHPDARSEWALTWVDAEGSARELVIDRTFVAADTGVRWLIDYKTSRPLPQETLAQFAARESGLYMEQLLRYRDALRALGDNAISCALFFTALGHLHHLSALDLPAR